jgi:hypothetical protein
VSEMRFVKVRLALVALAAALCTTRLASADDGPKESPPDAPQPFHPRFVGDLRFMDMIRTDNNYFGHANTYSYPIDPGAAGVQLNLGGELLPRLALLASAHFAIDGADRDSAHLRLQSGAGLGIVRWTVVRLGEADAHFDAALQGGFGRYAIKETYIDPALSSQTYEQDAGAWGGMVGAQASFDVSGFVAIVGYGFHYAPATISDRIGGTVQAGGNEISIGLGVWL